MWGGGRGGGGVKGEWEWYGEIFFFCYFCCDVRELVVLNNFVE